MTAEREAALAAGGPPDVTTQLMSESSAFGAVVPPIVQTSLFTFKTVAEMEAEGYGEFLHLFAEKENADER